MIGTTGGAIELSARVVLMVRDESGRFGVENVLDTWQRFVPVDGAWRIAERTADPLPD